MPRKLWGQRELEEAWLIFSRARDRHTNTPGTAIRYEDLPGYEDGRHVGNFSKRYWESCDVCTLLNHAIYNAEEELAKSISKAVTKRKFIRWRDKEGQRFRFLDQSEAGRKLGSLLYTVYQYGSSNPKPEEWL